jgi:hypothetical protein
MNNLLSMIHDTMVSRYVIKVMNSSREGGQVLWFSRTKGCPKPFNWSKVKTILYYFYPIKMQGRFKMEYRLFTIVRYNYGYYNILSVSRVRACAYVTRYTLPLTTNQHQHLRFLNCQ